MQNNDLISRSALIARMRQHGNRVPVDSGFREWETVYSPGVQLCIHDAEEAPAAEAELIQHGRWIRGKGKQNVWYCSECGERIVYNPDRRTYRASKKAVHEVHKRCRSCGAKMESEA